MEKLKKFEKFNQKISLTIEAVGLIGLLAMMVLTTADVIGAKVFLLPIFGALDIVTQLQLISMTFAASATLIAGRHIAVEFFVNLSPKKLQLIIILFANLIGFCLFIIITWRLIEHAYYLQITKEVSSTARIPMYHFAYCAAFACIPVCLVYLHYLIKSILDLKR